MAERRMFAKSIIDSDAFLEMPLSAQALYFHLGMRADDEGFVGNPKKIQKMAGASDDDCKLLIIKKFILALDSGIVVIRHWWLHNYIQSDRFKPTIYEEEKETLAVDKQKMYMKCIQNGYNLDTQNSIDKNSIDKINNISLGQKKRQNECQNDAFLTETDLFGTTFEDKKPVTLEEIDPKETMFNEFWQEYPRKVNKKGAKRSFLRIQNLKNEFENIMFSLKNFKNSKQWTRDGGQFIPHPQTWINQRRWEDQIEIPQRSVESEWLNS